MGPHQKITPAWAEKLCFTVTATGSYEEAAQVASKWGQAVEFDVACFGATDGPAGPRANPATPGATTGGKATGASGQPIVEIVHRVEA